MDIRSYYSSVTKKQPSDSAAKEQQDESQHSKHQDLEIEYVEIDSPESDFYLAEEDVEDPELLPQFDESSLPSTSSHQYSAHGESSQSCDYDQSLVHRPTGGIKSKPPGPCDISQCATEGPKQPILKKYPQTKFGANFRSFRPQWFQSFNWVEYSISQDAAYCFSCRFFSVSKYTHGEIKKVPFVNVGFSNWKNAMENEKGMPQHEKSTSHKESCVSWQDFKRNKEKDTSIMKGLSKAHAREVEENRHYIKTIAEVLLLTAKNKIAQREHRYNSDDLNHGNVREILYLVAKKDRIVQKKLHGPKNARYLHPSIQNELLAIMASLVREDIAESLKDSPFSILADETKDHSKTEQLSVVVRYFFDQAVHERFLKFYKADSLDAASLTDYIFNVLSSLGIDKNGCVGQAYDGAAVMSGRVNGVQARIQKEVPTALYVHCMNHRLNLAVVDTVKNVAEASEFFAKLEKLYVFSSTSVVHSVFESVQKEMSTKLIKLKQLSDTRWTCQYAACKAVLQTLEPLLETLKLLADGKNTERRIEANSILIFIDFNFILSLVLFENILKRTQTLSNMLQAKDLDLASAVLLVRTVIEELEEVRNDEGGPTGSVQSSAIGKVWVNAMDLCIKCGIETPDSEGDEPPRKRRDRRPPLRLRDSIIMETVGQRTQLSKKDDFIKHFVYVVLDKIISELKSRFSRDSLMVMEGIQALNPKADCFLNLQKLTSMAKFYGCNLEYLETELKQALVTLKRKEESDGLKVNTVLEFTNFLQPYAVPFFELYRLCKIACVLPVSSASCERSFSALKLIKSYLRTTMTEERLSDLATLAIEFRLADKINMDQVVDRFASMHKSSRINLY